MKFFGRRKKHEELLRLGDHDVEIEHGDEVIATRGLARYTAVELTLSLQEGDRGPDGHQLVDHVVSYVVQTGAVIKPGQTYGYGFWMLKFIAADESDVLHVGEVIPDHTDQFRLGASAAMQYWREQEEVCDRVGALHRPPSAGASALVSPGLYGNVGVEGSRYGVTSHSGWVLIADAWHGEAEDLMPEHLYHFTVRRPDLVRYLGLPAGYRFHINAEGIETDLEFDPSIA